jgi:hypothetical protein
MTKDDPDYEEIEKQFFEIARRLRGNPETQMRDFLLAGK